jgi:hypothetical protein
MSPPPPSSEAEAIAKVVLGQLASGEFAAVSHRFVDKCQALIPAEALKQAWNRITSEAGAFCNIVACEPEPADDPELCLVAATCNFDRGQLLACMLVDGEGHLNGLWFHAKQA